MHLSLPEHERFFHLLHGLQFYAIKRLSLDCPAPNTSAFAALPLEVKAPVRDAVYKNSFVITDYAEKNPDFLPEGDLQTIRQWTGFIQGRFFVERHLKKHSIWVHDNLVYAVLGVSQPLEEILPKYALPVMIEAVILPYNGKIVFDGVLSHRSISFGGGIKRSLRETYMTAKQNGRIIESLDKTPETAEAPSGLTPTKNWGIELQALEKAATAFKGEKHALHKEAIAVMKVGTQLATTALGGTHFDSEDLIDKSNAVVKAIRRFQTSLHRSDL